MVDRRSRPTKPGTFKKAQIRHQALQARRDALALLKSGKSVIVSAYPYNGEMPEKFKVRPFIETEPKSGQYVLALHNQRLRVLYFYEKGSLCGVWDAYRGHVVHPPFKDVFGVVVEKGS